MSFVYIAPLSDRSAFKVGKAIAPSSRLSQLLRYYDFNTNQILIVNCKTIDNAFALESILHKACEGMRVIMPYDGGTEFFSHNLFNEAVCIIHAVCRINGFQTIPFVRERREDTIDETGLIIEAFANKIRSRRLELNLRQTDVAKLAGVAKRTIERIEQRGQSTFYNMVAVLRALNLEYLLSQLEIGAPLRQRSAKFRGKNQSV
jgi:T5orf172 domain/Helix-turn-helix